MNGIASPNSHEYLSPMRKLVTFFHDSRDRWKAKHHEVKKTVTALQNEIRAVERGWRTCSDLDAVKECVLSESRIGGYPRRAARDFVGCPNLSPALLRDAECRIR